MAKQRSAPAKAGAQCTSPSARRSKALGTGLRRSIVGSSFALLAACTASDLPAGTTPLDPIGFFTGGSSGSGTLDPIVGRDSNIRVESRGIREGDSLRLVQRISEGTKPPRIRTWIMRPAGPGRYTGSLTDAEGPVHISVAGPRAVIRYQTPSGMNIRQQLALQQGGGTILNRLEAYKYGIRVAVLDETIRKPIAK